MTEECEAALPPVTCLYKGQCFIEFMSEVQVNGFCHVADSEVINRSNGRSKYHFKEAEVVIIPDSADITLRAKGHTYFILKEAIALLHYPGVGGILYKNPDYDAVRI